MLPTKRPNHRKTRAAILTVSILTILVAAAIALCVILPLDTDVEEKSTKTAIEESTEEQTKNLTREEYTSEEIPNLSDTGIEREYYVDYVDLAVLYAGEGVFDIHIRFPDGEDYVVVAGKAITGVADEGFYVRLTDRENHMLSSARTDKDVYSGTQMYLSRYESETGVLTKPDYPWNQFVLGAHGIDEAEATEIYARRIQLEENLSKFMNQTLSK